ncbi:TPA: fimbria/pilus periplasmic chaperone [Klebsiella quasipneumoniae subsp. similipneumoniae]|nr:fimbria/pilus periplasmic chaperone [Klebsiella pneumoniae]HBT4721645.1 fimbria/pilus periplasmic chaperone [Klebsiella quasipneumoniae subsp. similipneumoniae]HBT4732687.1 fimbria/pilus periplasmic chaperone [Klebsiella quasipneumoniae subsp. similipneumoniae]HBT4803898.1 fimbria/pilus periplasmic chaperone [Klebsiella quasipneumoniae subsp. similipneumoniae]
MFKFTLSALVLFFTGIFSFGAWAEVVINGTRIIFNAGEKETAVQLKNNGKNPYLLQMWMDDGNPKSRPGEVNVPFIITPPIVRIEPNKGQAVRIIENAPGLPQDRETLYWFNMLEVPPKPTAKINAGDNLLQLAFRTRVKFFYRPANLKPEPLAAYKDLKFDLANANLIITNDSPYFITFNKLEIRKAKNSEILASVEKFPQRMVEPKGKITLPLIVKRPKEINSGTLYYSVINDYGGESNNEKVLYH